MAGSWEGLEEVVAIADAGSFVGGAHLLAVSTSHISRVIARLEARLDTQIFTRTTRQVRLTDTGHAFVEQCRRIIQERDELLAQVNGSGEPQGDLRITCSIALGERFVAPIVRRFAAEHHRLTVTLDLTNRLVDLVGEGYDVGIRTGQVSDNRLVGKQIAGRSIEVCASPAYLAKAGIPRHIDDLKEHECLVGTSSTWHFLERGIPRFFRPTGRFRCNSGGAIADAAIAGMGICQLPTFYVRKYIEAEQMLPLLDRFRGEPEAIWAAYPQRRGLLPKVRNIVDALEAELQRALDAR